MAFKKIAKEKLSYSSPAEIFRDLPRRKIPDVLPHQEKIMEHYAEIHDKHSDIALQLPTGSGKTLVGLLIAEWRRRKFNEKIVYLCPTKQLANQVVEQSRDKYGIPVVLLIGSQKDFSPNDITAYKQADKIAVTTYSGLFNNNPFFKDAEIILLDDAHTSENYISSQWSVNIDKLKHDSCYKAVRTLLSPYLDHITISKMTNDDYDDRNWTDMLPVSTKIKIEEDLIGLLDVNTENTDLSYPWKLIRSNLDSCQIYLSSREILIRPLIPPTFTHSPFYNAKQRIYMSATLGNGGDLERLTGRDSIYRIPVSLNSQGVGRRFFMFPEMSLHYNEINSLVNNLLKLVERGVFLVPNNKKVEEIKDSLDDSIEIFNAVDIEDNKQKFGSASKAVAILANRYDGIDFSGDECRLLFIQGLPKATNLQEKFFMSQMGAHILYNERIQTKVIQAIGRCTRSLEDYSAVVVTGEDLPDYLTNKEFIKYLQPELQAEVLFGIEQSKTVSVSDLLDNFKIFIDNGSEWEEANQSIIELREEKTQESLPCLENLLVTSKMEINYQKALWSKNYLEAADIASSIIGKLDHKDLRGYRALWNYLAGYAEYLESVTDKTMSMRAIGHFKEAHKAAQFIKWLTKIQKIHEIESEEDIDEKILLQSQVSIIASNFMKFGNTHNRKYDKKEKEIRDGLKKPDTFEEAQKELGKFLGFISDNIETDGAPDPWWICENRCIVFEDYVNTSEDQMLNITKVRQAVSHPNWIRKEIFSDDQNAKIIPVVLSPVKYIHCEAIVHSDGLSFWSYADFIEWTEKALSTIRELRTQFSYDGDLVWQEKAMSILKESKIDFISLESMCKRSTAKEVLISKP